MMPCYYYAFDDYYASLLMPLFSLMLSMLLMPPADADAAAPP